MPNGWGVGRQRPGLYFNKNLVLQKKDLAMVLADRARGGKVATRGDRNREGTGGRSTLSLSVSRKGTGTDCFTAVPLVLSYPRGEWRL